MSANDIQRLEEEQKAITERLAAAKGEELEVLQRQYGERLSQLRARLEGVGEKAETLKAETRKGEQPTKAA